MLTTDGALVTDALVRTEIDPDESVLSAIVHAVAAVENVPISELPQAFEAVDPESLHDLLESKGFRGRITFAYAGYAVRVDSEGTVAVLPKRHVG